MNGKTGAGEVDGKKKNGGKMRSGVGGGKEIGEGKRMSKGGASPVAQLGKGKGFKPCRKPIHPETKKNMTSRGWLQWGDTGLKDCREEKKKGKRRRRTDRKRKKKGGGKGWSGSTSNNC